MRKIYILSLILLLWAIPVLGANTHSTALASASKQYWSITKATQTGLDITGSMTIEAWVKFTTLPTSAAPVSIASRYQTADRAFILTIIESGGVYSIHLVLAKAASSNNDEGERSQTITLTTGTWIHLAAVFNATAETIEFFKNGTSLGSGDSATDHIYNGGQALEFGANSPHDRNYLNGKLDDIRIWNDVRTQSEIEDNMSVELVGDEDNLQGYWRFNNDAGVDQTSNDNDLTNNNSCTFNVDVPGVTDTCTPTLDGVWKMDLQDHCTTTVSTYSDYGMECYNQAGGSWVIAGGVEVRRGSSTNCIPQIEGTGVFSIQPIH